MENYCVTQDSRHHATYGVNTFIHVEAANPRTLACCFSNLKHAVLRMMSAVCMVYTVPCVLQHALACINKTACFSLRDKALVLKTLSTVYLSL